MAATYLEKPLFLHLHIVTVYIRHTDFRSYESAQVIFFLIETKVWYLLIHCLDVQERTQSHVYKANK